VTALQIRGILHQLEVRFRIFLLIVSTSASAAYQPAPVHLVLPAHPLRSAMCPRPVREIDLNSEEVEALVRSRRHPHACGNLQDIFWRIRKCYVRVNIPGFRANDEARWER